VLYLVNMLPIDGRAKELSPKVGDGLIF